MHALFYLWSTLAFTSARVGNSVLLPRHDAHILHTDTSINIHKGASRPPWHSLVDMDRNYGTIFCPGFEPVAQVNLYLTGKYTLGDYSPLRGLLFHMEKKCVAR